MVSSTVVQGPCSFDLMTLPSPRVHRPLLELLHLDNSGEGGRLHRTCCRLDAQVACLILSTWPVASS